MYLSVCVFAHNEERLLPECVAAFDHAAAGMDFKVFIMVNGCTDQTAGVARTLACADPRIEVHELAIGDKANAWNQYVHSLAPRADTHIFIDGDIRPCANAFNALSRGLNRAPGAYAAAALPETGRSREAWRKQLYRDNALSGNLYAMSADAIDGFRHRAIRLPFGAKGEDGLLSYLLLTNLRGGRDDSHHQRITICEDAFFSFEPLAVSLRDASIYHRRLQRYSERHFQKKILYSILKERGAAALPENIYEIYTPERVAHLHPRLGLINFFYDMATLLRLRDARHLRRRQFA